MPARDGFAVDHSQDARGYRLVMRGELDIAFQEVAEDALIAAELEAGERMLIVDLRLLDFCGSVAVPLLIAAQTRSVHTGRPLLILPSRAVRRLFELAGVTDHFDLQEADLDGRGPDGESAGRGPQAATGSTGEKPGASE